MSGQAKEQIFKFFDREILDGICPKPGGAYHHIHVDIGITTFLFPIFQFSGVTNIERSLLRAVTRPHSCVFLAFL